MQLNGSENIWKELDSLYESELNELARFNKRGESLKEFRKHFEKHKEVLDKDGKVVYTYKTEDEYDEAAHELSSFPATPIGGKMDDGVFGFIDQEGRSVKFAKTMHDYAFVVFIPSSYDNSDYYGTAITYFHRPLDEILYSANPYHKLNPGDDDRRYRSDLDGGFVGLDFFRPVSGGRRGVTEEEAKTIKNDILNGRRISVK